MLTDARTVKAVSMFGDMDEHLVHAILPINKVGQLQHLRLEHFHTYAAQRSYTSDFRRSRRSDRSSCPYPSDSSYVYSSNCGRYQRLRDSIRRQFFFFFIYFHFFFHLTWRLPSGSLPWQNIFSRCLKHFLSLTVVFDQHGLPNSLKSRISWRAHSYPYDTHEIDRPCQEVLATIRAIIGGWFADLDTAGAASLRDIEQVIASKRWIFQERCWRVHFFESAYDNATEDQALTRVRRLGKAEKSRGRF